MTELEKKAIKEIQKAFTWMHCEIKHRSDENKGCDDNMSPELKHATTCLEMFEDLQ